MQEAVEEESKDVGNDQVEVVSDTHVESALSSSSSSTDESNPVEPHIESSLDIDEQQDQFTNNETINGVDNAYKLNFDDDDDEDGTTICELEDDSLNEDKTSSEPETKMISSSEDSLNTPEYSKPKQANN